MGLIIIMFKSCGIHAQTIPPSMVPDLHEKKSQIAKYQKSGLEALYLYFDGPHTTFFKVATFNIFKIPTLVI